MSENNNKQEKDYKNSLQSEALRGRNKHFVKRGMKALLISVTAVLQQVTREMIRVKMCGLSL